MGGDAEIENRYAKSSFERVLDVSGKSIVPGLVDAHTHPVWAGDRVNEFAMKVSTSVNECMYVCLVGSKKSNGPEIPSFIE